MIKMQLRSTIPVRPTPGLASGARGRVVRWFLTLLAAFSCAVQSRAGDFVYFSERANQQPGWSRLMRIGTDGSDLQTVIEGVNEFVQGGIAFDIANGHLYSGGGTWLFRANLDGSGRVNLVPVINPVQDVELDLAHGKIYWSEGAHGRNAIRCANLDGTGVRTFIDVGFTGMFNGLAVDPVGGKLYATYDVNSGADTIQVMNLDGSSLSVLYNLGNPSVDPGDLEIDLATGTLYFNRYPDRGIFRVPADGLGVVQQVLATPDGSANAIHFDPVQHKFYFIAYKQPDGSERSELRCTNIDGSGWRTIFQSAGTLYWMEVARIDANQPPAADAVTVTTAENSPVSITLTATDPDNDPLTFAIATPPAHGTLSGTPPNVTYTPAAGYSGLDSFTFLASDGNHDSAPAQVSITVTPGGTLIGTYTVNYRFNAAGCYVDQSNPDYSRANPYLCGAIPPGPIFITAAPGEYQLAVVTGTGCSVWSGDASGGTWHSTGHAAGEVVTVNHAFGQIALYFWDWYAWDNDASIQTTIAVYRRTSLPPTIVCPDSITTSTAPGQCSQVVNFTVTATGDSPVVACEPASGSQFPKGTTTVSCVATDAAGNTDNCSFTITVNDTEAPTIACPANVILPCAVDRLLPATYAVTATDNCDPAPTVTYSVPPGSGFPVGVTTVTATATDASGNSAQCAFTVTRAALEFTGFLPPIGGADATGGSFASPVRTFKLKSTIPVKFTASCGGAPVLTGIQTLQAIKWSSETDAQPPIDATPTDAATAGNQFRLADGVWHFNLDTQATGLSAGKWQLVATLSDGSQHGVWIQIK